MHSVLVVAELPKCPTGPHHEGESIREAIEVISNRIRAVLTRHPDIQPLHEGAWQIPLASGLTSFVDLCSVLENSSYTYRVLFFEEEPKWIVSQKPA
jgi:hypothetical protein